MDSIGGFFSKIMGGGAAQAQGPDAATLEAQRRQERRMQEEEARTARETGARQRVINATTQRGGPVTLFRRTGGAKTATLGG